MIIKKAQHFHPTKLTYEIPSVYEVRATRLGICFHSFQRLHIHEIW